MSDQNTSAVILIQDANGMIPRPSALVSRIGILKRMTRKVLDSLNQDELFDTELVQSYLLEACNDELDLYNSIRPKSRKYALLKELMPFQIAEILMRRYRIISVRTSPENRDFTRNLLCVYQTTGDFAGIYIELDSVLNQMLLDVLYEYSSKTAKDVRDILEAMAECRDVCHNQDLIAVNNGIFDYKTKQLLAFSPDYVFLTKCPVNYNPFAKNVIIHNDEDGTDWDVESWMQTLSDDMDVVYLLWQIAGAIIRPGVSWNKAAWFYSEQGNNGKGTLCSLFRNLCGPEFCMSLPLSDMGVEFRLEPLLHVSAIITDENDVVTFIDKAANLKAIVTGDMLQINRKFKTPVSHRFHGFMVQCLNEMPKVRDKSDSFFRRQIFVPFLKCFTGKERKYIKDDYLKRPEVLEYVLHKVLHMDYYELDVPKACEDALQEYKAFVDPVYAFLQEVLPELKWDLLPWNFLYDLYCAWYKQNNQGNPMGGIVSKATFVKDVKLKLAKVSQDWFIVNGTKPGSMMSVPEPLLLEYDLIRWMNPMYKNDKDVLRQCIPVSLSAVYRGIRRYTSLNP